MALSARFFLEHFEIKLPQFEGPFDLLLFFIERDELDIHDIPISTITNDFLGYIKQMKELNIELASEFILVAATLMRIKAKMLLPRPDLDEQGNEIDPRQDLVQRLLEYKRYKAVLEDFELLEAERMKQGKRGNVAQELKVLAQDMPAGEELEQLDLYKLMLVYERVLKRFESDNQEVKHTVVQYPYTIEEQKERILQLVQGRGRVAFEEVLQTAENKVHLVYSFLSILELLQQQLLTIQQGEGYNNFWLQSLVREN